MVLWLGKCCTNKIHFLMYEMKLKKGTSWLSLQSRQPMCAGYGPRLSCLGFDSWSWAIWLPVLLLLSSPSFLWKYYLIQATSAKKIFKKKCNLQLSLRLLLSGQKFMMTSMLTCSPVCRDESTINCITKLCLVYILCVLAHVCSVTQLKI